MRRGAFDSAAPAGIVRAATAVTIARADNTRTSVIDEKNSVSYPTGAIESGALG